MIREDNNSYGIGNEFFLPGVIASIIAHVSIVVLGCLRISNVVNEFKPNEPFVVYSVSAEGGKTLGGISQVSKTGKKEPIVPYKNVQEKESPAPKAQKEATTDEETVKIEKAKAEAEAKAKEEAEISIRKEKERKEKEAKAKAEAEAKAKKEAEAKAKAEAEAKAKKEAEEKKKKEEELKKAKEKQAGSKTPNPANAKPNGVVGGKGTANSSAQIDTQLEKALQRYIGESSDAGGVGFGAGRITGENGMGGGIVRPPEFFKYQDELKKQIKAKWSWFDTSQPYKVQVYMSIDKNGTISNVKVVTSSGSGSFDDSVLRAIQKASPVPSPPANVYEFFKEVRMTFDPKDF